MITVPIFAAYHGPKRIAVNWISEQIYVGSPQQSKLVMAHMKYTTNIKAFTNVGQVCDVAVDPVAGYGYVGALFLANYVVNSHVLYEVLSCISIFIDIHTDHYKLSSLTTYILNKTIYAWSQQCI